MTTKRRNLSDFLKRIAPKEYAKFWADVLKVSDGGMVLFSTAFF
jgi:hypothetical protein